MDKQEHVEILVATLLFLLMSVAVWGVSCGLLMLIWNRVVVNVFPVNTVNFWQSLGLLAGLGIVKWVTTPRQSVRIVEEEE
jgi:hypothetical protein